MSIRKINPHHFQIDSKSSLIDLSFASDKKIEITLEETLSQTTRKMRLLSLLIGTLYKKNLANAFRNIKFKPLRTIYLKRRLVQVFLSLVRKSEYNKKNEGFQRIKRYFIKEKNHQLNQLSSILFKAKISAFKVLDILFKTKERSNIQLGFNKVKSFSKQKQVVWNEKYRKGFRLWIKVQNSIVRKYFIRLRSSRYLIQRRLKIQSIFKVLKQYKQRCYKIGMDKLRRNLYKQRQNAIRSQILEIQSRIQSNEDEELKSLKQKQQQLQKSLVQVKKQKQEIGQAYQIQVKQAESKNIQIQARIKCIKQQNQKLLQNIEQSNKKLKQEFSLDQIFQMFYNNLLFYLSKNRNSTLIKSDMLQALTKPLVPVDIPIDQLKQENKTLKDLISEYVLIYGQKSLQGKDLQIPYEYLVKENQTMYKMLVTLLPRLQYNKKDVGQLRQTLESVQSVVKQFRM